MSNVDDLVAAGLYDPDAPDAEARLALFQFLLDELDASIPEIVQAVEEDRLLSIGAFRLLRADGERMTHAEVSRAAGVDPDFAMRVWRAAGFQDPRPHERRFAPGDVRLLELLAVLCTFVPVDDVVQAVRTFGAATAQIAEAEIALIRSNVEAPMLESRQFVDVARSYTRLAGELVPRVADALDTLHRHHLEVIGRRYSEVGATPSATNVVALAVGFADLSGYTGLSSHLDPAQLGAMITQFESTTGDVIAAAGANVVKRIGDAVMFVSNAPGVACGLALELIEACAGVRLPKLRVGVAFGDVVVRGGDFFGPVVNLAARLVAAADPGTALTDASMYDRLSRVHARYSFAPTGRLTLAGFEDPVVAYQLLR